MKVKNVQKSNLILLFFFFLVKNLILLLSWKKYPLEVVLNGSKWKLSEVGSNVSSQANLFGCYNIVEWRSIEDETSDHYTMTILIHIDLKLVWHCAGV